MDMNVKMKPIGYMKSVFHYKNGTPRQSSLCQAARGVLTIDKSTFNNPEHSLEGLDEFSYAWIIFIFHKNNNTYTKAKVKPPRLDGQKVGVFSTRSPYRPNNIGLSLVKIDKIDGPTVYFSGIDLLDGTPVLDIKPYIPDYDSPKDLLKGGVKSTYDECFRSEEQDSKCPDNIDDSFNNKTDKLEDISSLNTESANHIYEDEVSIANTFPLEVMKVTAQKDISKLHPVAEGFYELSEALKKVEEKLKSSCSGVHKDDHCTQVLESECIDLNLVFRTEFNENCTLTKNSLSLQNIQEMSNKPYLEHVPQSDSYSVTVLHKDTHLRGDNPGVPEKQTSFVAPWLTNPPVSKLKVSFTPRALEQLNQFSQDSLDQHYKLQMLLDASEAEKSIADILTEEPRSVYRRQNCPDSLYYFTLDVLHVTCWFDCNLAEVVRIKPVTCVPKLMQSRCEFDRGQIPSVY
ncbi:hypothetical protein Btru_061810 [Bulinus truncatus]|nr:hypothetical protein Btru_061810 [Bulinus truncatus]